MNQRASKSSSALWWQNTLEPQPAHSQIGTTGHKEYIVARILTHWAHQMKVAANGIADQGQNMFSQTPAASEYHLFLPHSLPLWCPQIPLPPPGSCFQPRNTLTCLMILLSATFPSQSSFPTWVINLSTCPPPRSLLPGPGPPTGSIQSRISRICWWQHH